MSFESKEPSESELSEADKLSVGEEMGTVDKQNLEKITSKIKINSPKNASETLGISNSIKIKTIKSVLDFQNLANKTR